MTSTAPRATPVPRHSPTARERAAMLLVPLALLAVAVVGSNLPDGVVAHLLGVLCGVLAVATGVVLAVVYRPRADARADGRVGAWTSSRVRADLAALDALEPLRPERTQDPR